MKKMASALLLVASLTMTTGVVMANAMNDDTDIQNFTQSTAQNGQNGQSTHFYGNPSSGKAYNDLNTYGGDN